MNTLQIAGLVVSIIALPRLWRRLGPLSLIVAVASYLCLGWFAPAAIVVIALCGGQPQRPLPRS